MSDWSLAPPMDWILRHGRHMTDPVKLVGEIFDRLVVAGMPLNRVSVFMRTLHPQYFGFVIRWDEGQTSLLRGEYRVLDTDEYLDSPMHRILQGERVIRRPLHRADCPRDFPVLDDLAEEGFTDYVLAELVFSTGVRNGVSLSSRHKSGFSDHDIAEVQTLLHLFALIMENHTNRGIAVNLLDTYLGTISDNRVLDGKVRRGDGDRIDAVIWFSDLRDSTRLAEELGHERFLEPPNDYFEATAGAVLEHGGEDLRFIGDASLAVFPIASGEDVAEVCARALDAARDAVERAAQVNVSRADAGTTTFNFGIGLHRGEVLYGNIGTTNRLEFSVIGPAANETARIEGLSKVAGECVVLSETVVTHLNDRAHEIGASLGQHPLRGVGRDIEIFGLAPTH
ncbi:MAG: adenylate/guanylate cyclase domain-containing protein [Chromatiales bacterium]|nr:adenylate/guanylate cyclase domain-containing protein [Chromatiales bacterium]